MFETILALIILPVFVFAAVCFCSWLRFNEAKNMYPRPEDGWEEELDVLFSNHLDVCSSKHLLKFNNSAN